MLAQLPALKTQSGDLDVTPVVRGDTMISRGCNS
jgi:hypothetical protein